jgi:hypothetical protein
MSSLLDPSVFDAMVDILGKDDNESVSSSTSPMTSTQSVARNSSSSPTITSNDTSGLLKQWPRDLIIIVAQYAMPRSIVICGISIFALTVLPLQ